MHEIGRTFQGLALPHGDMHHLMKRQTLKYPPTFMGLCYLPINEGLRRIYQGFNANKGKAP